MARQEIAVKKYVVTLSNEEREHLTALIHSGPPSSTKAAEGPDPVESRRLGRW